MPLTIVRQDITKMEVDAIVNAANTDLAMGGGVCGAIFKAAGPGPLQEACRDLAPIKTGEAVITPAFALPASYIIHAAGPVYRPDDPKGSEDLLRSTYRSAMALAVEKGLESLAFPLISSGIYGYPKPDALQVAISSIRNFLFDEDLQVYLVIFDSEAFAVSQKLLGDVDNYLDDHYFEAPRGGRLLLEVEKAALRRGTRLMDMGATAAPAGLDDLIGNLDEPFSSSLLRLIDQKGMTDVEVYKRANLDRKHFSKIRSDTRYRPGKRTVLALSLALKLSLGETEDLLRRAGYALSPSRKFDVIVQFFIDSQIFDIDQVNQVLFAHDQPLLGN